MKCKPGQRCLLVSAHPAAPACARLLIGRVIGRVIVKVTEWSPCFGGPVWAFEGPAIPCPKGTTCRFIGFRDSDLQPLPPEEDCIDANEPVDIEIDTPDYSDIHLEPT